MNEVHCFYTDVPSKVKEQERGEAGIYVKASDVIDFRLQQSIFTRDTIPSVIFHIEVFHTCGVISGICVNHVFSESLCRSQEFDQQIQSEKQLLI